MATPPGRWSSPGKVGWLPQMQVQSRGVQVLLGCHPASSVPFLSMRQRWNTRSASVLCRRYRQVENRTRIYEYGFAAAC